MKQNPWNKERLRRLKIFEQYIKQAREKKMPVKKSKKQTKPLTRYAVYEPLDCGGGIMDVLENGYDISFFETLEEAMEDGPSAIGVDPGQKFVISEFTVGVPQKYKVKSAVAKCDDSDDEDETDEGESQNDNEENDQY